MTEPRCEDCANWKAKAVPPEPQLWICPTRGLDPDCEECRHIEPHLWNPLGSQCNEVCCPTCVPYVESVKKPCYRDIHRHVFESGNWRDLIRVCGASNYYCPRLARGCTWNECIDGEQSRYHKQEPVNAPADMVDETETIQELTQKLIAIGESIPPEDLARLHANKVDKRIAELEADCKWMWIAIHDLLGMLDRRKYPIPTDQPMIELIKKEQAELAPKYGPKGDAKP